MLIILPIFYLIGSIPTGYWFAKYLFNIDVTKHGSGNIGATNVARVLGSKKYFFLIFFIDFLKAFLSLFFVKLFFHQDLSFFIAASICLLLGNSFSVFLKFKGGKGVATTLGILAFLLSIKFFIFFIVCWAIVLFFAKRVGVASLLAIYLTTIFFYLYWKLSGFVWFDRLTTNGWVNFSMGSNNHILLYFLIFLCLWLTFSHRNNLKSLFNKN